MARAMCILCKKEYDYETVKNCPKDGIPLTPVASTDPSPSLIGQVLEDRYKILELIGEGKTGNVYKAEQLKFNRLVAVKLMHSHLVNNEETVKRFQREAQAISKLRHTNLLNMIDFGITQAKQPYMVTEFLDGTDLESLVQRGRLDVDRALSIFAQICDGLKLAHEQQVIHRDIKPANIVLVNEKDGKETPKLIDFGLVKFLNDDNQSNQLTQAGQIPGTPAYMSPEQCIGQKLDARADIYSLGCVLYFALTGRPPFIAEDIADLLYKQVKEAPPPFSTAAPQVKIPESVEVIVFKALTKDRANRIQTAEEFQKAIKACAAASIAEKTPVAVQAQASMQAAAAGVQAGATQQQDLSDSRVSKKQQHVMHDVEKGSNRLVAKDQFSRVDDSKPEVFEQMRKRQSEDLSDRILRSMKASFVGDQTMAWLQNVNENVAIDAEPADKRLCQLNVTALMDKLFDDFQRYGCQYNQTEENREFVVSCQRPTMTTEIGAGVSSQGHVQNSVWAMKVVGDSKSIRFMFLPVQSLYQPAALSAAVFLELTVQTLPEGPGWCINSKPIYLSQLPLLSKKIFARLMRVSRGEISEKELLRLDMAQEAAQESAQTPSETAEDPSDVITYALISILEAVDKKLGSFQQEGVTAMKRGGIDALTPIMLKTKRYDAFREKTATLAKEWADMLVN